MISTVPNARNRRPLIAVTRAVIEVAFIVFLFYSNLLMGEFTAANGQGKTLAQALSDIFTGTNLIIGMISALLGYFVFEYLRKKLYLRRQASRDGALCGDAVCGEVVCG